MILLYKPNVCECWDYHTLIQHHQGPGFELNEIEMLFVSHNIAYIGETQENVESKCSHEILLMMQLKYLYLF